MASKKRAPTGRLRWQIFSKSINNLLFSPLFITVTCLGISSMLLLLAGQWWPLALSVLLGSYLFRSIVFEVLLLVHIIENSLGVWPWYTLIDDKIYLGAIPLQSLHHLSHLTLDVGIKAVLSINQPYELTTRTVGGLPVQAEEWEADGVRHCVMATRDFLPPPMDILDAGADFIRDELMLKHKVYVHCKSGIGRSASVVIAYLIKHRGMPASAAAAFVRERRPAIFSPSSSQMKNILLFEARFKADAVSGGSLKNV